VLPSDVQPTASQGISTTPDRLAQSQGLPRYPGSCSIGRRGGQSSKPSTAHGEAHEPVCVGSKRWGYPPTEERIFPASRRSGDRLLAEHWARYRYVAQTARGRILDLGCGTGYGSRELARTPGVAEVVGVDRSEEALAWAMRYYRDPKVRFYRRDLESSGWERGLGLFDEVIAFEIIEHLADEKRFWSGIDRCLRGYGLLWISTPLGRGRGRPSSDPFHLHQLRRSEAAQLPGARGKPVLYGQTGRWIEPWVPGRRYYTVLVRARRTAARGNA